MKLSDICAEAERFQCKLILPEPRPGVPWGPFPVVKARLDPSKRLGTLTFSRKAEDGWKYGHAGLQRGDCLIHVPTGATACVVGREGGSRVAVEGWTEPETEEERAKWAQAPGTGNWIVWGTAFRTFEEMPAHVRPGEVISPEDYHQARQDLFRHPERLPWAQAGFHVGVDPKKLSRKQRKKLRGHLRRLLGGLHEATTAEDLDALIEKEAKKAVKSKLGGEFINWKLRPRPKNA